MNNPKPNSDKGTGGAADRTVDLATLLPGKTIATALHDDEAFLSEIDNMVSASKPKDVPTTGAPKDVPPKDAPPKDAPTTGAPQKDKPPADEPSKDAPSDDDFSIEIPDDVTIDGVVFKKDELSKVDKSVVVGLADIKGKLESAVKDRDETKNAFKAFQNDPVIADRIKRLSEGKANEPYASVGVTKETFSAISDALRERGVSDEDAAAILQVVIKEANTDLKYHVESVAKNLSLRNGVEDAAKKTDARGMEIIKDIVKLSPNLTEDIVRKWCTDPERKGTAKTGGLSYSDVVKISESIGVEGLFAAVAKANNLPIAINTGDRDKTIAKSAVEKALDAIGVKRIAKSMRTSGQDSKASISDAGKGIDPKRINDPNYIDKLLDTAKTDDDMFKIQKQFKEARNQK
jgi:hypothetical protein